MSGGPRRELGDDWKPLVYSAAIASLVPERDKLRAENEGLVQQLRRMQDERDEARRAEAFGQRVSDGRRARLAKLEAVAQEFVDAVDAYESSAGDDALYDAAKEKHGALILLLDSAKGSDGGQTEAK